MILLGGNFAIWFEHENDVVACIIFLCRGWETTTIAFVKLVHSLTCLCVFGGEAV